MKKKIDWVKIEKTIDQILQDSSFYDDFNWVEDIIINEAKENNDTECILTGFNEFIESYRFLLFESILSEKYLITSKIKTLFEIEYEETLRTIHQHFIGEEKQEYLDEVEYIMKINNTTIKIFLNLL